MAGKKKKGKKPEGKGTGEDTSAHNPSETRSGKQYQPHEDEQQGTRVPQSGPPIGKSPPLRTSGELLRCEEATAASVEPPVIPRVEQDTSEPPLTTARILLHAGYDTAGYADTDSEWFHRKRRKYVEKRDAWYRDNDPEAEEGREDAHAWLRDLLAEQASLPEDAWQELEWAIWDVQKLEASIYHSTRAYDARNHRAHVEKMELELRQLRSDLQQAREAADAAIATAAAATHDAANPDKEERLELENRQLKTDLQQAREDAAAAIAAAAAHAAVNPAAAAGTTGAGADNAADSATDSGRDIEEGCVASSVESWGGIGGWY